MCSLTGFSTIMRDRRRGSTKWDFWKQLTGIATVVIHLRTYGGSNGRDPRCHRHAQLPEFLEALRTDKKPPHGSRSPHKIISSCKMAGWRSRNSKTLAAIYP